MDCNEVMVAVGDVRFVGKSLKEGQPSVLLYLRC